MTPSPYGDVLRAARRHPLWTALSSTREIHLGRADLERILPHRGSIFLLDSVVAVDLAQQGLRASRKLPADDPIFAEHFPDEPVYPAAFTMEMLGQAAICAIDFVERGDHTLPPDAVPRRARVIKVHGALLLEELKPGDELILLARLLEHGSLTSVVATQALRGERVCAVAILEFLFLDR